MLYYIYTFFVVVTNYPRGHLLHPSPPTTLNSLLRHPSYFGFYYWALGSQLMMMNPVCFVGFAAALHHFFSERIQYEEQLLVRFFGQDYKAYQARTQTGIPLVR